MKKLLVVTMIVVAGALTWGIANRMSADAIGLGLGILLGVLAGIPSALLVLVAGRRRTSHDPREEWPDEEEGRRRGSAYPMLPHQAPIIVLTSGVPQQVQTPPTVDGLAYPQRAALPGPTVGQSQRSYKVVGETEEWLDGY